MKVLEGNLTGKGLKIGIVASRFNDFIVEKLVAGAVDALVRHEVDENDITNKSLISHEDETPMKLKTIRLKEKDNLYSKVEFKNPYSILTSKYWPALKE